MRTRAGRASPGCARMTAVGQLAQGSAGHGAGAPDPPICAAGGSMLVKTRGVQICEFWAHEPVGGIAFLLPELEPCRRPGFTRPRRAESAVGCYSVMVRYRYAAIRKNATRMAANQVRDCPEPGQADPPLAWSQGRAGSHVPAQPRPASRPSSAVVTTAGRARTRSRRRPCLRRPGRPHRGEAAGTYRS